jgi:ABC-type transporter Mla maintaining outer membrane lipid asymmetry permease subunit MlaE
VAVSRRPFDKAIDNSRVSSGAVGPWFAAVGHNVVVPRLVAACDERHACRRVIVLAIVGSLVAAPAGGAVGTAVYDGRRQQYAAEVRTEYAPDPIANSRAKAVVVSAV